MMKRLMVLVPTCAVLLACGGSTDAAKTANDKRDLEIHHESCDVDSAQKVDANNDGRPDIFHVMKGGKEVCRAIDMNFDGVKDAFIYFDDSGQERRRESDFDRDGVPDEITILQGGVIQSKERETNFDHKIDTWDTYVSGRLAKSERDSDADGIIDEWWEFNRPDQPDCAVVATDRNADGQPDPGTEVDMCGEGYKPPPPPVATPIASATEPSATPAATAAAPSSSATAAASSSSATAAAPSSSATAAAPSSSATTAAPSPSATP